MRYIYLLVMERVRVEYLGILPIIFSNRCKACSVGLSTGLDDSISEYPPLMRKWNEIVSTIAKYLLMEFGYVIDFKVINPFSLKGIYYLVKFRKSNIFIIGGKHCIPLSEDYGLIRKAVLEVMGETGY